MKTACTPKESVRRKGTYDATLQKKEFDAYWTEMKLRNKKLRLKRLLGAKTVQKKTTQKKLK